jgi:hypothetical protein
VKETKRLRELPIRIHLKGLLFDHVGFGSAGVGLKGRLCFEMDSRHVMRGYLSIVYSMIYPPRGERRVLDRSESRKSHKRVPRCSELLILAAFPIADQAIMTRDYLAMLGFQLPSVDGPLYKMLLRYQNARPASFRWRVVQLIWMKYGADDAS